MDVITFLILCGFILTGFLAGYPIGVMMERRHQNRSMIYGHPAGKPAPVRSARNRLDAILDAEILEEKHHAR